MVDLLVLFQNYIQNNIIPLNILKKEQKTMDTLTAMIASEIKKQYKSVRKFSQAINIPQTTLASTLKNGVSGTAYETIVKICKSLDIQLVNYQFPLHVDDNALKLLDIYNKLDEKGQHAVHTVLKIENERCSSDLSDYHIAAFSGRDKTTNKKAKKQKDVNDILNKID